MPMSSQTRFMLNFSGSGVREQQDAAHALLERVAPDDHAARTRLSAILAASSVFSEPSVARDAAALAASSAKSAGDEVARGWAVIAQSVADLSCDATAARLELTREALQIARRTGETEFVTTAYFLHLAALAELGQMDELDHALSPVGTILSAFPWLNEGRHVAWFRCLQATLDGQTVAAEQLAHDAHGIAQHSGDPDAQTVLVGQLSIIRWMQGRVVELEPAFLRARQEAPHEPIWGISLAWMWLRQGRTSAARALVSALGPFTELPVDRNWLASASILADVASELRETTLVRQIYDSLLPFEDRLVTIGLGVTCWGTVARPLALAANALGDAEGAAAHYRAAIAAAARTGAHAWLAEAQWELARLLAQRAHPGDHDEAVSLASEAVAAGRALHLHGIEGTASNVLASLDPSAGASSLEQAVRPRIAVFDTFSVTAADGSEAPWQSRKARQLLKILVARRGAAVSRETVMDLLWPGESAQRLANRFSVATTTVRRALDPAGAYPRDAFVRSHDGLIRLRLDAVDIDIETFLMRAQAAVSSSGALEQRRLELTEALALYTGEPLQEEQEELWADELRREAHLAFFAAAHVLAELHGSAGDHLARLETYRRILALDEFDRRAHEGVIDALVQLGSLGQAEAARGDYELRMRALGVPL